jgi:hypothetical protein
MSRLFSRKPARIGIPLRLGTVDTSALSPRQALAAAKWIRIDDEGSNTEPQILSAGIRRSGSRSQTVAGVLSSC